MAAKMRVKKGDQVVVIAGKDRGRKGKVLRVDTDTRRVLVERLNMAKRHTKPNPRQGITGGIQEKEAFLHESKVQVISPESGRPTRIGYRILEDGRKVRFAKVDGAILDS